VAFDYSWPIIERARQNIGKVAGVTLIRANSRGRLPFKNRTFDIVFCRLAPLGAHGVPNVQAAFELLKPGGWFFEAGWEPGRFETPQTEWAIQHGFAHAEHHVWQYERPVSGDECVARLLETTYLSSVMEGKPAEEARKIASDVVSRHEYDGQDLTMTHENLTISHKSA
jgi:SAM-dependent methyltransferase